MRDEVCRFFAEYALSAVNAPVHHHVRKLLVVVDSGYQARSARLKRGQLLEKSAQTQMLPRDSFKLLALLIINVHLGKSVHLLLRHIEISVRHAERLKYLFFQIFAVAHASQHFYQRARNVRARGLFAARRISSSVPTLLPASDSRAISL